MQKHDILAVNMDTNMLSVVQRDVADDDTGRAAMTAAVNATNPHIFIVVEPAGKYKDGDAWDHWDGVQWAQVVDVNCEVCR